MRQATAITTVVLRVFALCFLAWASIQLVGWAIRPVLSRIYSSEREPIGFDFSDIRDLSQIGVYVLTFFAIYFTSITVARAATSPPASSLAYSVAFTTIRTLAFVVVVIALLEATIRIIEIPINHIRQINDEGGAANASFWAGSSFLFGQALGSTVAGLSLLPFWMFAGRIANVISRPFQSKEVA